MSMSRARLLPLVSAAWFVVVLSRYHRVPEGFPAWSFASLLSDAALLAAIAFAAWGAGAAIMRWTGLSSDGLASGCRAAEELGAGLGALAFAVFALSALGILYRPLVLVIFIAAFVAGVAAVMRRSSAPASRTVIGDAWERGCAATQRALLLLAGVATLAAALAPPEFYDALIYHLAVPEAYIRHHGMVAIEGNYYASFPANMGMLYVVGLMLGGAATAQGIHWLCAAATAAAIHATASRHCGRSTGLLAASLFALTPGVLIVSTWAIADLCVTLFATLCFGALLDLWAGGDRRALLKAGLFAGLAMGTKYTAALVVCAPAALLLATRPVSLPAMGARMFRRAADIALFAAVVLALVSPWFARNAILEGSPLAPYVGGRAGDASPSISDEVARRLPKEGGAAGLIAHYLGAPWSVTMERLGQGGYLTPVFLMFVPLIAFVWKDLPRAALPVALLAGGGLVAWALTTQVTRYLMPVLPLFAILAALAAARIPRWIAAAAVLWCLLYGLFLFGALEETVGVYRVVTGVESRDEYLSRRVSYYPAARFLGTLPRDARVLFAGEGRTFYVPREAVAATPFDRPAIDRYDAATGEDALRAALRKDGITHLLVSDPELKRTRGDTAAAFMQRHFPSGAPRRIFDQNGVEVYQLP